MPYDAPAIKVKLTASHGARIIQYDRYREDRIAITRELAEKDGMAIVPPFDHEHVIAGQGTAALELFEDVGSLDAIFMPLGGGGLLAGSLLSRSGFIPAAAFTASSRWRATMASNRCARGFACGSTLRRPSPTARRRSSWAS